MHLPGPNDFIPTNFETHKTEVKVPAKRPNLIKKNEKLRLWYKKDDTFWVPRANVWILFRSPLAYATPSNCVKTRYISFGFIHTRLLACLKANIQCRLYTDLLKDSLNEYAYDAEVAGLCYNIENQLEGMLASK